MQLITTTHKQTQSLSTPETESGAAIKNPVARGGATETDARMGCARASRTPKYNNTLHIKLPLSFLLIALQKSV